MSRGGISQKTFIEDVCGMSPFEFLIFLESSGKKMDGKILEDMVFDACTSEEAEFIYSCFREVPSFDELLVDRNVMGMILRKHGFSLFGDSDFRENSRKFSIDEIFSHVLPRRPGIVLRYYVNHLKDDVRFFSGVHPGFLRFEEIVWAFVSRFGGEASFPKNVLEKATEVHFDIYNTISILN